MDIQDINIEKFEDDFYDIISKVFSMLKLKGNAYAEVEFLSEEEIAHLNSTTRGLDKPTDVLSYPFINNLKDGKLESGTKLKSFIEKNYPFDYDIDRQAVVIGNIAICPQIAIRQASEYGHGIRREINFLYLHGLLHLLGYDHLIDEERLLMRKIEDEILDALNITRQEEQYKQN